MTTEEDGQSKRTRKPKTVGELCEQGTRRLEAGRKAQARESFTKAITLDPACEVAWVGLAAAATNDADRHEALRRALEINPENAVARRYFDRLEEQRQAVMRHQAELDAFKRQLAEQQHRSIASSSGRAVPTRVCPHCQRATPIADKFCAYCHRRMDAPAQPDRRQSQIVLGLVGAVIAVLIGFALWGAPSAPATTFSAAPPLPTDPSLEIKPFPTSGGVQMHPVPVDTGSAPSLSGGYSGGTLCRDGTHSSSTGRGTCSHHGGIAK